jgi:hypothetical protein
VTRSPSQALTIKESHLLVWMVGASCISAGVILLTQARLESGIGISLLGILILLWVGPGDVTTIDPLRACVVIKKRSFVRRPLVIEIPFDEIVSAAIKPWRDGGDEYCTLVLVCKTGEHISLMTTEASSRLWHTHHVRQINALLGVEGEAVPIIERPIKREVQEGTSGGVAWQLEILSSRNGLALTRWFSAGARLPNQFVALGQVPSGISGMLRPSHPPWGPELTAQVIADYFETLRLDVSELPGIERAAYHTHPVGRLGGHFMIMSGSAEAPRTWLTPRVVDVLQAWAQQHPVRMTAASALYTDMFTSLTVLVSPKGLWVMCQSVIKDQAMREALIGFGVALVQACNSND